MPIYEYICNECNNGFEKIQSSSSSETTQCDKCKGEANRVMSASSYTMKNKNRNKGPKAALPKENVAITTKTAIVKDRNTGNILPSPPPELIIG